jgi:hypothetical protein
MNMAHVDFAKIERASNGQQVLFWFEPDQDDEDEDTKIHCIAHFDDFTTDMAFSVSEGEDAIKFLSNVGVAQADAIIRQIEQMMGIGTKEE